MSYLQKNNLVPRTAYFRTVFAYSIALLLTVSSSGVFAKNKKRIKKKSDTTSKEATAQEKETQIAPRRVPQPQVPTTSTVKKHPDTREKSLLTTTDWIVGIGFDWYSESSSLEAQQSIDIATFNESYDYKGGPVAGRIWASRPWKTRFRLGGGLAYHGDYTAKRDRSEFQFGQLFDFYGSLRFTTPAYKKFDFIFEAKAGLSFLLPGGDFSDEIDRLQADGIGVFGGPRLGWNGGLSLGTRYPLHKRVSATALLGMDFGQLYLFRTKESVKTLKFQKNWHSTIRRTTLALGIELSL